MLQNVNDPQKEWCRIVFECADALYYTHSKEYLHNDLKGDNVIINETHNSLHPVIIDFGKSTTIARAKSTSCLQETKKNIENFIST